MNPNSSRLIKFFSVMLLPLCSLFALGAQAAPTQPAISDPAKPILVTPGQKQFSINLKSNPSTGYVWIIKSYDHNLLEIKGQAFQAGSKDLVGAPGITTFTFKIDDDAFKASQMSHIDFIYARPWEMESLTDSKSETSFTLITQAQDKSHKQDKQQ
ncbi:protease inhibitor I42 family protein [Dongshaea marina]|uniref:protease inhibitor I42 family protein n=1 Tax=Dongshaea marina TaxID=2047966 RepID=UPI000D3E1BC7|nr:protease inhibitor I42 family protein [Dongshaea marina]